MHRSLIHETYPIHNNYHYYLSHLWRVLNRAFTTVRWKQRRAFGILFQCHTAFTLSRIYRTYVTPWNWDKSIVLPSNYILPRERTYSLSSVGYRENIYTMRAEISIYKWRHTHACIYLIIKRKYIMITLLYNIICPGSIYTQSETRVIFQQFSFIIYDDIIIMRVWCREIKVEKQL